MMSDTTIVIQGRVCTTSLQGIEDYLKFGPVILSCYEDDDVGNISNEVQIVKSPWPTMPYYGGMNVFLQSWTTYAGLVKVKTKLAIKVRSDESYSDLSQFINTVQDNENKLTTANIFFKKADNEPLHPSDHIIGSTLDNMLGTFSNVQQTCIMHSYLGEHREQMFLCDKLGIPWLWASGEVIIFLSFLLHKGLDLSLFNPKDLEYIKEMTRKYAALVNIDELGDYIWTYGWPQKVTFTDSKFLYEEESPSLKSLEEL